MKYLLLWPALWLAVGLLLLASPDAASARTVRFPRHRPPPAPVYTAVGSVDRAGSTITTVPKNSTGTTSKTYRFNAQTHITINGQPGTVADLKPGQRIRVGLGADADLAEELSVTTPPKSPGRPRRPHVPRP